MRIDLAVADDWVGLYVDGVLHHEGHRVPDFVWVALLSRAGITASERAAIVGDPEGWRCPKSMSDVRWVS